ncbi:uncharacterized protein KGF55_003842 [Candida pseudojiufengensis]|uniref:uncharacterized protein n=1 Tax=Candida pseudojiufengensis TaxID=497109 RepID=UPI0022252102|nr:uncharacterized protein KGF55_003842 [Candida pseudojiufengensis]KAI5961871.1 hypothetical protein KGF55_003842 [Candida pseudojiufengensis]
MAKHRKKSLTLHEIFNDEPQEAGHNLVKIPATSTPIDLQFTSKNYAAKKKIKKSKPLQDNTISILHNQIVAKPQKLHAKSQLNEQLPTINNLLDPLYHENYVMFNRTKPFQPKPIGTKIQNLNTKYENPNSPQSIKPKNNITSTQNLLSIPYYHQLDKTFAAVHIEPQKSISPRRKSSLSTISEKHTINYILNDSDVNLPDHYQKSPELGRNEKEFNDSAELDFDYGGNEFDSRIEASDGEEKDLTSGTIRSLLELGGYKYSDNEEDVKKKFNIKKEKSDSDRSLSYRANSEDKLFVSSDDNGPDENYYNIIQDKVSFPRSTNYTIHDSMDLLRCEEPIIKKFMKTFL